MRRWLRAHWGMLALGLAALLLVALVGLALFPWGTLRASIEARLSHQLGRPVTIGSMVRVDDFSLDPEVEIRDLRIPQPDWVKDAPMLTMRRARFRFAALPMLFGSLHIESLDVEGASALLVRDAKGRTNWGGKRGSGGGSAMPAALASLTVSDTRLRSRDATQDRAFDLAIKADATHGLDIAGTGTVLGAPVKLHATGGSFAAGGEWPFELGIEGDAVGLHARGASGRPLDFADLHADLTARAADFAYLDALVEGGLPDTQPVTLSTSVRHRGGVWTIERLEGTIGRSDIAGEATVRKVDGRNKIDGALRARRFDFHDLASDAGLARAAAKNARFGKRVVPDTKINLATLGPTDGVLRLHADELLWPGSKPFRSLDATLELDGKKLTIDPLRFGLTHGTLAGTATVVQVPEGPKLHLVLTLRDGRLVDLFPEAGLDAPLRGRLDVTGIGVTVRAAIGRADGRFALVAEHGTLPDKTAILLGQDVGRGLFASKKKQAELRCIVAGFEFNHGVATASTVAIDTSRALTRVDGVIRFPEETLALALIGEPKQHVVLRVEKPIPVRGTIKAPDVGKPADADSLGDILKQVGQAIFGHDNVIAPDLDCPAAAAHALDF